LAEIDGLWDADGKLPASRSDSVMGGFVDYVGIGDRTRHLRQVEGMRGFEDTRLIPEGDLLDSYFTWPSNDRFADWIAHKASLVWPLYMDLSQRFFDALVTGQVPIVVGPPEDLVLLLSRHPEMREHVVIASGMETEALAGAREQALEIFDAAGPEGVELRHAFGRLQTLEYRVLEIARSLFPPV
jgi:hypothetical protein